MSKYKDKNNREINLDVAVILGLSLTPISPQNGDGLIVYPHSNEVNFDPCNNPSDAWPIIISTGMSIELAHSELGGIGTCTIYNSTGTDWQCDFSDNSKALRAAMICFLKMKDAEAK